MVDAIVNSTFHDNLLGTKGKDKIQKVSRENKQIYTKEEK